jgi:alcohol dehydrogenase (cytochrome c)
MTRKRAIIAIVLTAAVVLFAARDRLIPAAGRAVNYVRSAGQPAGTLAAPAPLTAEKPPAMTSAEWPSYNRTLTSDRYSPLSQIDPDNVAMLKVMCTYDTGEHTSFQTGPIMVNGAIIATTEHDIFSIDAATCRENWRTHEDYKPAQIFAVNRGAAYLDGLLYRGSTDGRVLAYDFKTGARVWATSIADVKLAESTPAAPIAWSGLVFIGNAGGDNKGSKGRMYALDAKTGKIVWEFYLVPKGPDDVPRGPLGASPLDASTWGNEAGTPITGGGTWTSYTLDPTTGELYVPVGNPAPDFALLAREGSNLYTDSVVVIDARTGAYKRHFKVTAADWHDWDVSNAPSLFWSASGRHLMAVTPKDGHLYAYDLSSNSLLYRVPVDRIENAEAPFSTDKMVHFCPGTAGGAEWNGSAYDPKTNLILIGEVDWCGAVRMQNDAKIHASKVGEPWPGMETSNPYDAMGKFDPKDKWGGWVYASNADTGAWNWRARSNYPIQSGMTPTAGGVVFFGDMGGNFYALETASGRRLWSVALDGAIGGGVITYSVAGAQKVAVAAGFTSVVWPTRVTTGKIVVFGLPGT